MQILSNDRRIKSLTEENEILKKRIADFELHNQNAEATQLHSTLQDVQMKVIIIIVILMIMFIVLSSCVVHCESPLGSSMVQFS